MTSSGAQIYVPGSDTEDETPIAQLHGLKPAPARKRRLKRGLQRKDEDDDLPKPKRAKKPQHRSLAVLEANFPDMYNSDSKYEGRIHRSYGKGQYFDTVYVQLVRPVTSGGPPTCLVGYRQYAGTKHHDPVHSTTTYDKPKVYMPTTWTVKCFPAAGKLIATDPDETGVSGKVHIDLRYLVSDMPIVTNDSCD